MFTYFSNILYIFSIFLIKNHEYMFRLCSDWFQVSGWKFIFPKIETLFLFYTNLIEPYFVNSVKKRTRDPHGKSNYPRRIDNIELRSTSHNWISQSFPFRLCVSFHNQKDQSKYYIHNIHLFCQIENVNSIYLL